MDFTGTVVSEEITENRTIMVINHISIATAAIDVSGDDNFGLTLKSNINISNEFYTSVAGRMNTTYRIMRVGMFVSKTSLAFNHKMVQ